MPSAAVLAEYLSDALILLTAASAANAVWRRRDTHRLNILAFVAAVAVSDAIMRPAHRVLWTIGTGLFLAQPYLLLRLARHFRHVPALVLNSALAASVVGMLALSSPPLGRPRVSDLGVAVYLFTVGMYSYAALSFSHQAARTAGVTARRLALAAAGTWIFTLVFAIAAAFMITNTQSIAWGDVNQFAHAGALACYFLAFTTPRRLRATWQRAEQARYLSATADRDPEDRGRRAPSDLLEGAKRGVGHSLIVVALRPSDTGPFVVNEATDRDLVGAAIDPSAGVIGRVVASKVSEMAAPSDCAPDLAQVIAPLGTGVLVAPIASSARLWGVIVAAQRRGALFAEDDLVLLGHLGRYAATALDHAALVVEARDRERRRADLRLHAAEARTRLMLDSIKDYAMFVLDADGLVVTWHVGAEQVFDYTADEMTGDQAAPLFNLLPAQFQARLDEARQMGRSVWEGPCRRKNGDRFLGSTVIRPLAGEADLAGFVAVTRDVTEQRDLEDRLRQGQKMEAIGQLAGGIAHDFNNMLLAILGYADLLAEDAAGDAGRLELIVEIQRAAERAAGLTRRLLAFGRRQILQPGAVSLSGLVTDLLPMLRRVIAEHIEIVTENAPQTRPVLGDRSQLEQVIVNLAVNARDAMPQGGRLTIRTSTERLDEASAGGEVPAGAYALLEVTDTGIGMDAATRGRIFEPFFTTKGFGYGTGLGLATVYGIVKQMGGLVQVTSEPGQGTTFRIYLPETRQLAVAPVPAAASPPPRGHETLLLVEDDEAVRLFLMRTLERHGYRVLPADHPSAALAIAKAHADRIHLVVTDVVLPGIVGPEFVRALADLRGDKPPLPVLYISGYADGSPVWQGEVPKASHFLQKPFSAGELLNRIRQILSPAGAAGDHAV